MVVLYAFTFFGLQRRNEVAYQGIVDTQDYQILFRHRFNQLDKACSS